MIIKKCHTVYLTQKKQDKALIYNSLDFCYTFIFPGRGFFSYLLCMAIIANPKRTATTIKIVLINPVTPNDILIKIVEITNPEFLMIL